MATRSDTHLLFADEAWWGLTTEVGRVWERVILVMDNAGWHRARDLRVPPNVILWFLPPHCPEANPVEQVWQWLREHHARGELFRTRAAARRKTFPLRRY